MKNIGRRLFAKALPAAPLVAGQTVPGVLGGIATEGRRPFPSCAQKSADPITDVAWAMKREKLDKARNFLYERNHRHIDYFRRRKNNWTTLDPNIMSLRSVSDQHKIHMHIAAEEALDKEKQSWQDSVLEMFGLDKGRDRYELF
jgi:hypothetical protein